MELVHASPLVKGGDAHADCNMVDIGGGQVVVDRQPRARQDPFEERLLQVRQEFAAQELCGLEARNNYFITSAIDGRQMLHAAEESDCLERIFCRLCRGLTMNITLNDKNGPSRLKLVKHWHWPQCPWPLWLHPLVWFYVLPRQCLCRDDAAEFSVYEGERLIGRVRDNAASTIRCVGRATVLDSAGAYALQLGPVEHCSGAVCCPCVWGERVPVHDASGASELAEINRPPLTCAELCGHTNRFVVDLGGVGGEYRKLLLAAGLLWDLTHWEVKG